jgi:hypothetical protein
MKAPENFPCEIYFCTNLLIVIRKSCRGSSSCEEEEKRQDEVGSGGSFDVWMLSADVI